MNILVMDAQGGGIGKQVVTAVRTRFPDVTITAVGTNAAAKRILIPVNHCANFIAGVADMSVGRLVDSVVAELEKTVCRA